MQVGTRCAQKSKKIEKMQKDCEKVAQDPPKGRGTKTSAGYAMACQKSDRTKIGPLTPNVQPRWGGTPAHCLRFAHPAEADWRLQVEKPVGWHHGSIPRLLKKARAEQEGTPRRKFSTTFGTLVS